MTLVWRKSSHSGGGGAGGQECVEVADLASKVAMRDSKDPDGPRLIITAADWRTFACRVKDGEHDLV